jgi:2-oxoglutarate dehydrogenase E1 component
MDLPREALDGDSLAFVEQLYWQYLKDPKSLGPDWQSYFAAWGAAEGAADPAAARAAAEGPSFEPPGLFAAPAPAVAPAKAAAAPAAAAAGAGPDAGLGQDRVNQLIHAYRVRGHLKAKIDPLGRPRGHAAELELKDFGLAEADLEKTFSTTGLGSQNVPNTLQLREILAILEAAYCGAIGVQFMHIDVGRKKRWLTARFEDPGARRPLDPEEQKRILGKLTDAELFEQFVHRKFVGKKRFSLEGAETLIPLLDLALEEAAQQGVQETILGMAHRGRLNVLVNIVGKPLADVFFEFQDRDWASLEGGGDVKYHLGYSKDHVFAGGRKMHLALCFNPSHLEFVGAVLNGRVRAKQDFFGDDDHRRCLGISIHGDAAFAGQGVTQELLNMSQLPGYAVGGILHVIVNNQLGFTTPPTSGRSTVYATDVARMLQSPIFHVNGEDPEAVAQVVRLAMDYRLEFGTDVVIDMYCYRKYGHNEGDEPAFTQPLMYEVIKATKSVRESYLENLLQLGGVSAEEAEEIRRRSLEKLDAELAASQAEDFRPSVQKPKGNPWAKYRAGQDSEVADVDTGVSRQRLQDLLLRSTEAPAGFKINAKLQSTVLKARQQMAAGEKPLDWGAAETLALASLVTDGRAVRLSGQDTGRGTFSHRHAVFHDEKTGERYIPLRHLSSDQAAFEIWDSPLSEIAVMGFEYGYSLDYPDGLTVWEAQFGDFCNVAQVIIDQFIASGEAKWKRFSGLTLLLPHGMEGQGPEHSSARLERFLNLCAKDNIQVVNPTTPAQIFHLLRRQVVRPWRKPLVVMTPKSLLRLPAATSSLEQLATGRFERLLGETWAEVDPGKVKKVLLTSGKLYYELEAERTRQEARDVAILRIEQYYPLDPQQLRDAVGLYPSKAELVWVQEEPRNMGAWTFLRDLFEGAGLGRPVACVSRPESASPAIGSEKGHKHEQAELIEKALAKAPVPEAAAAEPAKAGTGRKRAPVAVS